jgi:hypothetical protein
MAAATPKIYSNFKCWRNFDLAAATSLALRCLAYSNPTLTDASAIAFEIFKPPRQISEGC